MPHPKMKKEPQDSVSNVGLLQDGAAAGKHAPDQLQLQLQLINRLSSETKTHPPTPTKGLTALPSRLLCEVFSHPEQRGLRQRAPWLMVGATTLNSTTLTGL